MMAKANLGSLLGNVDDHVPEQAPPTPPAQPGAPAQKPAPKSPAPERKAAKPSPRPTVDDAQGPAYLKFVRKDTRLREDQQDALTVHARRLNRNSRPGSARITENSLIRIAVDLLLARIGDAAGDEEATILESLKS